jgi:hypothetical protein
MRFGEGSAPFGSGVVAALTAFMCALAQIPSLGESMEHRIKRAGANGVAVPAKLFDQSEAVDVSLGGVMQNV